MAVIGLSLGLSTHSASAQTFTGEGNWKDAERWDTGIPADGATAIINGVCEISENIGSANNDNPGQIIVGQGTSGTLNVTGGTLSGAHGGGAGIYVGQGAGGVGEIFIAEGTALRSQGGNMVVRIGDTDGGTGKVTVAGELLNFKFFEVINGALEMLPTGINNKFNSTDRSIVGANGTLAYVIDGDQVGTLERANANGLNVDLEFGAKLKITLEGDFQVGDSWTLMRYHELTGTFDFPLFSEFTNEQGYTFSIDYGFGFDGEIKITLTSTAARPTINSFTATPAAVASGGTSTLSWDVGGFDSISIDQGVGDVSSVTQVDVSPANTTTYTLTLTKGAVVVTDNVTVVVEEPPIVGKLDAASTLLAPGDATTLSWKVDGAETISISNVGNVGAVGEQSVTPASTTTYVLTAENAYGTATAEVTVVVDAILVSLTHRYDAAAEGNNSAFWKDSVGINNFDVKNGELIPDLISYRTDFTKAQHMLGRNADTGADGLAFEGGSSTYEVWVRPGDLDGGHQVIWETGGGSDGRCILITEEAVRFLNSELGARTHDFTVPLADIDTSDFVQIVAVVDDLAQQVTLYVKGSAGGAAEATSLGSVGTPNGRSTLFSWSSFNSGPAGSLGGAAGEVPEGIVQSSSGQFMGEMALFNIFGRALSAAEVQTQFDRHVIPDPGLITSFTATPDRVPSGGAVTLAWEVGAFDTLEIVGVGDVSGNTSEGMGSLEVTPDVSQEYVLEASNSEGTSVARVTVLVDIPTGAVVLVKNTDTWADANAWSDGQPAHSGADYIVDDFLAKRVGTPVAASPSFPGKSLELRGAATELDLVQDSGMAQINDLRLNGGRIVLGGFGTTLGLGGTLNVLSEGFLDIPDTYSLQLAASLTGSGSLTALLGGSGVTANTLSLEGNNSAFTGDLTLSRGKTTATQASSLGSGDVTVINGELEIGFDWNSPDTTLTLQGNQALVTLILFNNATVGAMNIVANTGIPIVVPPGQYDDTSWPAFLASQPDLTGTYLSFLIPGTTLTVQGEDPRPIAGTTFTGTGNWMDEERWSDGVAGDGANAVINGAATIDSDIAPVNTQNPNNIYIGSGTTGSLNVIGGTLSGAYGGSGVFVGVGAGGEGLLTIAQGAEFRSQAGGMRLQIGDNSGGVGMVSVAGQLRNYKWFSIINGTLEMLPTGTNALFNSADQSSIGPQGTLAFVIEGDQVGTLRRANDTGLVLDIDPAATLKVTLVGSANVGDTWTLLDYSTLTGQFAQGTAFTNEQGHEFAVEYGSGDHDVVTLRLTKFNPDALPPTLMIGREGDSLRIDFTGTLEQADSAMGPWSDVSGESPLIVEPTDPQKYYRSRK